MTDLPAGVQHGTWASHDRYKCRCDVCATFAYRYRKQWNYERAQGLRRNVDIGPVREHIRRLLDSGLTTGNIAAIAGVRSYRTVLAMLEPEKKGVRREIAARILAIAPRQLPENAPDDSETFVSAEPTRRRIQALLAMGWTHQAMKDKSGVNTGVLIHQASPRVTWRNHVRIRDLYDDLSMTPGPSERTRRRAAKAGYLSPLAWDDDAIDDVAAWASPGEDVDDEVDPVVVDRLLEGADWRSVNANRAERIAAALRMDSANEADRLLGLRAGRDYTHPKSRRETAA